MIIVAALAYFLFLVLLANVAEKFPRWKPGLLFALLCFAGAWALLGLTYLLAPWFDLPELAQAPPPPVIGWLFVLSALLSLLLLIPAVLRFLSRWLPLSADSPVHLTSLFLSFYSLAWSLINLVLLGGVDGLQETADAVSVVLVLVQGLSFVAVSLLGVGWLVRRNWLEVLTRLGLNRPDWQSLAVGAAAVILLMMINFTIAFTWSLLDPARSRALGQITDELFGNFDSLGTILLLALVSSVSEEFLFRGALQPRLGLPLTSILFAFVHLQYAITPATLIVLVIGVVLGLLRRYFGTWAAILAHFGYNFSLLLLGFLASKVLEILETVV